MNKKRKVSWEEDFYLASQWKLMWRKFIKHKLAILGGSILVIFYIIVIFCEFFSTQDIHNYHIEYLYSPPQRVRFFDESGFSIRPFVYGIINTRDPITRGRICVEDKTKKYPIYFFYHGDKYRLWNLFEADIHLLGVEEGTIFLFGTDRLGRDLFSRNLYAARISLSIGLIGMFLSFILGSILGGISGYYGGTADVIIQRIIEFLISIPTIPLWMGLAAALPPSWPPLKIYFGITIILAALSWCSLARVVRGKLISLRESDFVLAAKIVGTKDLQVITKHLLPSFLSYLIVRITLSFPGMILGETTLSFLGIGLRYPVVSWGVLLSETQNFRTVSLHPWLLIPGLFVIVVILAFNFLGDGLRDAADPYK